VAAASCRWNESGDWGVGGADDVTFKVLGLMSGCGFCAGGSTIEALGSEILCTGSGDTDCSVLADSEGESSLVTAEIESELLPAPSGAAPSGCPLGADRLSCSTRLCTGGSGMGGTDRGRSSG